MKASELIKKLKYMIAIIGDHDICNKNEELLHGVSHMKAKDESVKEFYTWHFQLRFKHPGDL